MLKYLYFPARPIFNVDTLPPFALELEGGGGGSGGSKLLVSPLFSSFGPTSSSSSLDIADAATSILEFYFVSDAERGL